MRTTSWLRTLPVWLGIIGLAVMSVSAATPALDAKIALRAVSPQDLVDYGLTGQQGASGLSTIGIGQPAYLEVLVANTIAPSNIVGVTWIMTNVPANSAAVLTASPLGPNVPTYKMVDRLDYQVADRKFFRPDATGDYKVLAVVETTSNGTVLLEQAITGAKYMGIYTCTLCHSGGQGAENMVVPWSLTPHASLFTRGIDGLASDHYGKSCISCHTVGYDVNTNAVNDGFDDIMTQTGWQFPSVMTNGNWAAMPAKLRNVANIQCESCHGPGSEHAFSLGDTARISATFASGDCAQCHGRKSNHVKNLEWDNSKHAIAVEETEAGCARCHSAKGFANYASGAPAVATPYEVITCAACHDPHSSTNTSQLRTVAPVTLMDKKTTITEGGTGLMCMNCHMTRRDATNYVETTAGSSRFGPHHGPQADMLAGANAITYGKVIPSSAHLAAVPDSCATCHMQDVASTNVAFLKAGGHTFNMTAPASGTNGPVQLVGACVTCHGDIKSFDLPRQDYDGNGVVEGVQTEVKSLLAKLALLLPPKGEAKTSLNITTNWNKQQLRAAYNYLYVLEDGSFGVHNVSYAVGLLKASIADLNDDANNDGLADSWQKQYFGSISDPNAAPNATPAGDGVPNWLKFALGLNPWTPGIKDALTGAIVYADGAALGGNSPTNTVQIYTAAEVTFDTEVGKTYQIQEVTSLSGGWQNVGAPIVGTGTAFSYVTPTRKNVQQFFRVSHTP